MSDAHLQHAIAHAAHLLPAQGPISVFIHHNTLHAFEADSFDVGVQRGAKLFGCRPYLLEDSYRDKLNAGRIRPDDVAAVLAADLGDRGPESVAGLCTRAELRSAMLTHPLREPPAAELDWFVAETDALTAFRPETPPAVRAKLIGDTGSETAAVRALWDAVRAGVGTLPPAVPPEPAPVERPRDRLLAETGVDTDDLVNPFLIQFTAAYLDQGFAPWPLPGRDGGFLAAFTAVYASPARPPAAWLRGLPEELARIGSGKRPALDMVRDCLAAAGVADADLDDFLMATFLALRGWGGMVVQVQERADSVARPIAPDSLTEFLAVRLLLDQFAAAHVAQVGRDLADPPPAPPTDAQRAFPLFQLAQLLGWSPAALGKLSPAQWAELAGEVAAFHNLERRRVFHAAFERRFRHRTLAAIARQAARDHRPEADPPAFQAITCLDEREESFRRHLEEIAPAAETFGAAGFFGVAMYYQGAAHAHFVPLCPVVIKPKHYVTERVVGKFVGVGVRRAALRRMVGTVAHRVHVQSRTALLGAALTGAFGALASVPLVVRILFPRFAAWLRGRVGGVLTPPTTSDLALERPAAEDPGPEPARQGYAVGEMLGIAERLLADIGLTRTFAPLVLVVGHGSSSLNNPHESAHDCGACGGGVGGANARAVARMLNDPRVRAGLRDKGIAVPDATWFVGGLHNTCNDTVTFFDTDRVPAALAGAFRAAGVAVAEACDRNAHERSRRFLSAPPGMTPRQAKRHVEERTEDLAQIRPEYGHATNAIAVVGRRHRTRGLFLDRRAFLVSYDPTADTPASAVLTRILQAVVPVCGGINLEYYFGHVDSAGFGCGTKLPHNITSLLGVMDGAGSDLRTGLPWQMTEIHEPVRLLIVLETTPDKAAAIFAAQPGIAGLIDKGWVQVATLAPDSAAIHVYEGGRFVPHAPEPDPVPTRPSSVAWYAGHRDYMDFAAIEPDPRA